MNPFETAEQPRPDTDVAYRVAEVLEGYLLPAVRGMWPGTDGLTVTDAVGALYHAEVRAGRAPDLVELVRRHPELGEGIAAFFGQMGHAEVHRE